ncbi:phytanoyl-CoA dioxygenase family protein [Oceanibacterium hippocampi]|uniref:Kanamycin B dioxygenase n=1 Tax=Oceanibacterium hippocampi TaxID=745714 RepID=A0A1Y5TES5_9PROT|nr:phytanoyl-CoA dioxygenase family protein [Oceanibacterium hippocampi]SLN60280.1 Kanamycin B dioxygenase [Oceanibacterium hippocampi]
MGGLSEAARARHLAEMRDQGFTVVPDVVPAELIAGLRAAIDRLEAEEGQGYARTRFEGLKTLRIYNLLAHDAIFARIPVHPPTLSIAEGVLDSGLQLSSLSAIVLGPGQEAQPIHADSQLIPLPRPHPPLAVNCMWALTDFTEANGATRVVPGSHRLDHAPDYFSSHDSLAAEMPAGSAMFFDSALWHGGGGNRTAERRYGIACYYCAGWVRQQENQQLGVPAGKMRGFPRRLQELCGYSVYQGLYGHVDNRDPIEMLGCAPGSRMIWEASDEAHDRQRD